MTTVQLKLKQNGYPIVIGRKILPKLGARLKRMNIGRDAVIITCSKIYNLHGKKVESGLKKSGFSVKVFKVADGEGSKSAETAMALMEKLARYDVLKQVFIVALGGGVIGDLAGYVAAAYKRGVPYVQVPTTFLAQIDSAIGGKVAIDLPVGKNLVGAFYQPKMVFSDTEVLKTLPVRQIKNGMAEAIKYGVIYDKAFFKFLQKNYSKILKANSEALAHSVRVCSRIKAEVVMADEKETKGIRTILNYGHTVGHAVEAAGAYKVYQHGEAIGLGMRVAGSIGRQLKLLSVSEEEEINTLITATGLPKYIRNVKFNDIHRHMKHDKKFITGKNRFVLARGVGKVVVREGVSGGVIDAAIRQYFK